MMNIDNTTVFSRLKGVEGAYYYDSGSIRGCMLNQKNTVQTLCGSLIPKYGAEDVRRKYIHSISFYESGAVKSICLEKQTDICTSIGTFPTDLVTFYKNGALKRLFPLNGKISAYWTEADEKKLCRDFQFNFSFGSFRVKIINLSFYESGNIKAITLWPGESVIVRTSFGLLPVRIGLSLYEDGSLKSAEPASEIPVPTPIGNICAYDENALGITGDKNSLSFNKDGTIHSVTTSSSKILVHFSEKNEQIFEPSIRPDPLEENKLTIHPLKISFDTQHIRFEGSSTNVFDIKNAQFTILNDSIPKSAFKCGDCSSCTLCR